MAGFIEDLFNYAKKHKWKILIPFILIFIAVGAFLLLVESSAVIPVIYTIF